MELRQILVVEDDDEIRESLIDLLEVEGLPVAEQAANGEQALRRLDAFEEAGESCVVLLDLNMPVMGGLEFLRQIRSRPYHDHVIIVLSGNCDAATTVRREEVAVDAILPKPCDSRLLIRQVKESQSRQTPFQEFRRTGRPQSLTASSHRAFPKSGPEVSRDWPTSK